MERGQVIEKLVVSFNPLLGKLNFDYLDIREIDEGTVTPLFSRRITEGFKYLTFETLGASGEFKKNLAAKSPFEITMAGDKGEEVNITVFPYERQVNIRGYIVVQGKKMLEESLYPVFITMANLVALNLGLMAGIDSMEKYDKKFKADVSNMRNIQAKLFPNFKDIQGLDLASVYLPSDKITGNFIDGTFLDQDTYQLVVCDVSSYHSYSSYIGAVLRTIITTYASKKFVPSSLIELIIDKFKKTMKGIETGIYISIYQLNKKSGKIVFSSFGEITTLFFNSTKKNAVNLKESTMGKEMSERKSVKDLSFNLGEGDILLHYARGLVNVSTPDGRNMYSESRLMDIFKKYSGASSLDIVHAITESIYEFSDYAQIRDDIILISIKKI